MTVTIVFAGSNDGQVSCSDLTRENARQGTGSLTAYTGLTTITVGQQKVSNTYVAHEGFFDYSFSVPTDHTVTGAEFAFYIGGTSLDRTVQLEMRENDWGGTVTTADYENPVGLIAGQHLLVTPGVNNNSGYKWVLGANEYMRGRIAGASPIRGVAFTDRQFSTGSPTANEVIYIRSSEYSGTAYDPYLVFTSVHKSRVYGVLGAQVQLSNGHHAYLEGLAENGSSIRLRYFDGTTHSTVATLPLGNGSTDFENANGAQSFGLFASPADHLYVVGQNGATDNMVSAIGYVKNPVSYTWTAQPMRSQGIPSVPSTLINNVTGAWHNIGTSGTLLVWLNRTVGYSDLNDSYYALLNCDYLLTGVGSLFRGSWRANDVITDGVRNPGLLTDFANETGTLADMTVDSSNPAFGYSAGPTRYYTLGAPAQVRVYKYEMNSSGTTLTYRALAGDIGLVSKSAASKIRIISAGVVLAVVFVQPDPIGLTVVFIDTNTMAVLSTITYGTMLASMPSPSTLSESQLWDVLYDNSSKRLRIYYTDTADSRKLMMTRLDVNTLLPSNDESVVVAALGASGSTSYAMRVHRNQTVAMRALMTTFPKLTGGTYDNQYDMISLNVAPSQPTLTQRANYDATAAATFAWTFQDENISDTQSAYELQVVDVADDSVDIDTGKITSGTSSRNVTGGTLANSKSYRWRVRTYDSEDEVGPWSDYGTFMTSAGGTVTITDPATDNQAGIDTSTYSISWSVSGTTQASYRVVATRSDTGATLVNTGWVASTATSYQLTDLLPSVQYSVAVTVRNAGLVESLTDTRLITPEYASPVQPTVSVVPNDEGGYISIEIDNPEPGEVISTLDGDFETDTTGWTATNCTFVSSTDQAHLGTHSGKMTVTGSPTSAYVRPSSGNRVAVTPNAQYRVSYWAYSPDGHSSLNAAVDWSDSGGTYISTSSVSQSIAAATWTERIHTFAAPLNAAFAVYGPTLSGNPPTDEVLYVDEVAFSNPSDQPIPDYNQILRRRAGTDDPYVIIAEVDLNEDYRDYAVASGVSYEYVVRAVSN